MSVGAFFGNVSFLMRYSYTICGLRLQLDTEREIWQEPYAELFSSAEAEADVRLQLRAVPEIVEPVGIRCRSNAEHPVWRSGSAVSRCSWDAFRPKMHFRMDYRLDVPDTFVCSVREEYWRWATRPKYLWPGVMLNTILLHHRGLIFHASYIVTGGRAILFTAPSQTGKSTQAELWRKFRGARVVNGDKAGVTLRGRPMAHGVPFSGTSGICENVSAPLAAIVVLSQAPDNTIRRLGPSQAAAALCPNLFADQAVSEEWALALQGLLDLVASVPVYALACTPDERAVEALERAMDADRQTDEGDA